MLNHSNKSLSFAVFTDNEYREKSKSLSKRLALPLCHQSSPCRNSGENLIKTGEHPDFFLRYESCKNDGPPCLKLFASSGKFGGSVTVDFCGGKSEHRRRFGGGRGQPLAKAIGLKSNINPTVVDATAGLGNDAFVIANLGAKVTLIERSPIFSALLEDGLERASCYADLKSIVTNRMKLVTADAIEWLVNLPEEQYPDVIYMDPMYPHRNKSALVKKEMRVLREIVGDDEDACQLLHVALSCAKRRVTVKRPRTASILSGGILKDRKPSSTVESKNTRYDIYVP